jgi:opacity protein-like surface antigen
MKSLLLSIASFFFLSSFADAQGFNAGIKFGTNVNKISGEAFSKRFTYGYSAGAFAEIKIHEKWKIQPEVLFNQMNTDTSDKFSQLYKISPNQVFNIKLSYLSLPILASYKLSKVVALQAGPQYAILINQSESLLENGKKAFKQGDFSLLAGVQVKLASIRIYGRYAIGLNNLNDIDNRDKWRNQSIQLGIGFAFL